jgi:Flp pilus assembly protein TadD
MSLLNDALRKNDREKQSRGKIAGGPSQGPEYRRKRHRRYWMAGIGFALILVVGVGVGLLVHSLEATSVMALEPSPDLSAEHRIEETIPSAAAPVREVAVASADLAPEKGGSEHQAVSASNNATRADSEDVRSKTVPAPALSDETGAPDRNPGAKTPEVPDGSQLARSVPIAAIPAAVQRPIKIDRAVRHPSEHEPQAERYYRKALSYHRQGRLDRAIALYRQVVQLQPHHFDARFNLVSAYIDTREFTKAHHIAGELYRQDGTNQHVLSNLAIAKIGMGQSREALQLLDQVTDLPQASMFTIYLHKGIACRNLNQMEAALDWYKRAEELKPDNPQLLFNLALASDRQQQYGEAVHYYQAYLQQAEIDGRLSEKDIRRRISTLRSYLAEEKAQEAKVK